MSSEVRVATSGDFIILKNSPQKLELPNLTGTSLDGNIHPVRL